MPGRVLLPLQQREHVDGCFGISEPDRGKKRLPIKIPEGKQKIFPKKAAVRKERV